MKFRPCIDIHNGKVKQIVGGMDMALSADSPIIPQKLSGRNVLFPAGDDRAYFQSRMQRIIPGRDCEGSFPTACS